MYGVETELKFGNGLPAVKNSMGTVKTAKKTALNLADVREVISQEYPSFGSEDFSFYQQKIEGCMVRFGAFLSNETGPAHSSTFDFDEDVFKVGASWLAAVAYDWLYNEYQNQERT